jgi:16S rRNA (guanine1207-N2)-methyltransferase
MPNAVVTCTYLDLYRTNLALNYWRNGPPNLRIECAADFVGEEADVVALPLSAHGEAELTRDLIQAGHLCLKQKGRLYAATDNRNDTWLDEQLRKLFRKLECRRMANGVLYVGTKTDPLRKIKDYSCEFAFRDGGRLIRAYSRPGVFSHRRIDTGARRLIEAMDLHPGMRVLDIGCGAGVVALAVAFRTDGVHVHAVDSNARAVQCTERGVTLNGLTNLTTELNATGHYLGAGQFDLALANPPYYADFRIARYFVMEGRDALRAGGTILIVTKRPDWYRQHLADWYCDVLVTERKGYFLVQGTRPSD